jgi:phage shock protein E
MLNAMRSGIVAVVAIVLAAILFSAVLADAGDVSGGEARKLVAAGATLLDVRTREEFAAGHIDGAVNIPVQELEARLREVGAKDRSVVVYCRSGRRSATAKQILEKAGWKVVRDLGAMTAW